jgi:hypothetical protein
MGREEGKGKGRKGREGKEGRASDDGGCKGRRGRRTGAAPSFGAPYAVAHEFPMNRRGAETRVAGTAICCDRRIGAGVRTSADG